MGRFGNGLGTLENAGMYLWRPERALGSLRGVRVRSGKLWGRSGDAQEAAWNAQNHVKYDVFAVWGTKTIVKYDVLSSGKRLGML